MRTIRAAYRAKFLCPPVFWLFYPLASQYCLHQLSGTSHVVHLSMYNRRFVPFVFRSVCFHYTQNAGNVNSFIIKTLHKKVRLILYKLTKRILYILQYIIAGQPKNSKCRSEALRAVLSVFQVKTCFYMPDHFIQLYTFHTV